MMNENNEGKKVFYAPSSQSMEEAILLAQQTFNYFWRELYWEFRRVVKAHDLSVVKVYCEQTFKGSEEPVVEHLWINEVNFDGEIISGILLNSPNQLTNISEGDRVEVAVNQISDWMFVIHGITYGGFTIHLLRSQMSAHEREVHDKAWGLYFGDYNHINKVYEEDEHPENLIEHPMSINMAEQVNAYFDADPEGVTSADENGLTMLHHEAIAGNKTIVDILFKRGAGKNAKTNSGKTAYDYAKLLNWEHLTGVL